jgi:hypothetical protein
MPYIYKTLALNPAAMETCEGMDWNLCQAKQSIHWFGDTAANYR